MDDNPRLVPVDHCCHVQVIPSEASVFGCPYACVCVCACMYVYVFARARARAEGWLIGSRSFSGLVSRPCQSLLDARGPGRLL